MPSASLDGIEPGLFDLLLLERQGIRVLNRAYALISVHDKLLTGDRLEAAGLPHPRAGLLRARGDLLPVTPPVVVKPRFGSWGRDVFRCGSEQEVRELLGILAGVRSGG